MRDRRYEAECEVLSGYYFDEGRSARIGQVAKSVFERRAILKKEGNPLQECMKLVMNSAYGKNGQKPSETDIRYIKSTDLDRFVSNNFHKIASMAPINENLTRKLIFSSWKMALIFGWSASGA